MRHFCAHRYCAFSGINCACSASPRWNANVQFRPISFVQPAVTETVASEVQGSSLKDGKAAVISSAPRRQCRRCRRSRTRRERVPVVAAGDIADRRGRAAALALDACGIWTDARFVVSAESANHPGCKERIVSAKGEDIVETTLLGTGLGGGRYNRGPWSGWRRRPWHRG
jgi:hypothetical protein